MSNVLGEQERWMYSRPGLSVNADELVGGLTHVKVQWK